MHTKLHPESSTRLPKLAAVTLIFGALTVFAGSSILFGPEKISQIAGETVGFVLWFNFLAGFLYLLAAYGLWRGEAWSVKLAGLIALLSVLTLAALAMHIIAGGAFEMRTPLAMGIRTLFWIAIYHYARNKISPAVQNS